MYRFFHPQLTTSCKLMKRLRLKSIRGNSSYPNYEVIHLNKPLEKVWWTNIEKSLTLIFARRLFVISFLKESHDELQYPWFSFLLHHTDYSIVHRPSLISGINFEVNSMRDFEVARNWLGAFICCDAVLQCFNYDCVQHPKHAFPRDHLNLLSKSIAPIVQGVCIKKLLFHALIEKSIWL